MTVYPADRIPPFWDSLIHHSPTPVMCDQQREFGRSYDQGEMTEQKRETLRKTLQHIARVQELLGLVAARLFARAVQHDDSKLREPELSGFAEMTEALPGLTYGSDEYFEQLEAYEHVVEHHYAENRHHPEHFEPVEDDDTQLLADAIEILERRKGFPEYVVEHLRARHRELTSPLRRMNLIDFTEMGIDWMASSERHDDGDIHASIEQNVERFGLPRPMADVLHNTADLIHQIEEGND